MDAISASIPVMIAILNKGWLICAPGCSLSAGRAVSPQDTEYHP